MTSQDVSTLMQHMGARARAASAVMARAPAARKNQALRELARLLGEAGPELQEANEADVARAQAAGLAAPMVDRLRLTPGIIATLQEGCLQLASMADIIG